MGKKQKSSKAIVNATQSKIDVNIDYDKLAAAIVMAMEKAKKRPKDNPKDKPSFRKTLKHIGKALLGKVDTEDRMTAGAMAHILTIIFYTLAALCFIGVISVVIILTDTIQGMGWQSAEVIYHNIISIVAHVILALFLILFIIMLIISTHEMEKTEDKHFVAAVFSGVVSFAALVVSLIALKN